ncbi:E3 ubiquitin-protein ligase Midline-1-like isoform X2 [Haliotis cracherodii]
MDVFDDPCTLVCYHTFCRKCVVSYTETRPEAISAKSLLCPFCRKMTKVVNSNRPVEEWAQEVKPSFLIQGLLDSFSPCSQGTNNCNLCDEDGETTPANAWCVECNVSLCDGCLKAHRRIPATRHHDVSDLSRDVKVKKRRKAMCKEHTDQRMQFYCKDCKKLQCQSCCILYHRKCESIVSLESVLPEMQNTLQTVKQKLETDLATSNTRLAKKEAQCTEINENKSSLQSQVRSATQTAIDLIKKKERQLLEQIDDVTLKQIGQLKGDMKREEMARQMIRQHSELLGRALESESDVDICEMYLWSESEEAVTVSVPESGMEDVSGGKACFLHDRHLMCEELNGLHLGVIDIIVEDVFDSTSTAVLYDTVDIQAEDDEKKTEAYDVAVFVVDNTDTIVVTDRDNKCVNSFYKRNKKSWQSKLGVQSAPLCIAKLNNNKMAVTLPDTNKIIIVEVKPELVLQSSISTRKGYYGLTSLTPTTLAAGSSGDPPCVDILDMAGNVLRTLDPVTDGERLVSDPWFLSTTTQGNILVSCGDYGAGSVLCLTPHGDVVFRYQPIQQWPFPGGITETNTGHILVIYHNAECVIQLSASGTFVRDVLTSRDGITSPYGLYLGESQHLYVTDDDCVKIYRFTRNT